MHRLVDYAVLLSTSSVDSDHLTSDKNSIFDVSPDHIDVSSVNQKVLMASLGLPVKFKVTGKKPRKKRKQQQERKDQNILFTVGTQCEALFDEDYLW